MGKRIKTGVFGGTFNPPHLGHLCLAKQAMEKLGLDKLLIMPACVPPHKEADDLASAKDRVEMCSLNFGFDPQVEVSSIEIERGEKSYTVETLAQLEGIYPDSDFYLIIGSDMLASFTRWYRWEEILERAFICAASREKGFTPDLSCFTEEQKKKIIFMEYEPFEVSSSEVRERISQGESVQGLISPQTERYIMLRGLYDNRFASYRSLIDEKLDEYRLYHSLCVAKSARRLAEKYGADPDKAELAGMLHDVMKNASREEQLETVIKGGYQLNECERANHKVWHAMAGEAFLRLEGITDDEEILSAVRWHTTGRAGMSLLEKIVYTADFISSDRVYPDVDTVRALADESLEKAIAYTSAYTVRELVSQGKTVDVNTVDCYNDITLNLSERK